MKFALPVLAFAFAASGLCAAPQTNSLEQEAGAIAQRLGQTLKPELKAALESGGPAAAVEVCSERAPAIASNLSEGTGWIVARVSLKPRNRDLAAPDEWERRALETLAERQAANEDGSDPLAVSENVGGEFRFMKAQVVEPLCLTCHGKSLAPEVAQAIESFYPNDRAIGYALGEVRGGISLRKVVERHQP